MGLDVVRKGDFSLVFANLANAPRGGTFVFPVNPESIEVTNAHRAQVTPTFGHPYVEHFGVGIGSIQIGGTMGWGGGRGAENVTDDDGGNNEGNGAMFLRDLATAFRMYAIANANLGGSPPTTYITFSDNLMDQSWVVVPEQTGLRVQANKSSPLLRRYSIGLAILDDLSGGTTQQTAKTFAASVSIASLSQSTTERFVAPASVGIAGAQDARVSTLNERTATETQGSQPFADLALDQRVLRLGLLSSPERHYTHASGDTLASVAELFGTDIDLLVEINQILNPEQILAGFEYLVPAEIWTD